MTLTVKTRWAGIFAPLGNITDIHIPDINKRISQLDKFNAIFLNLDTTISIQGIDRKTRGDCAVISDSLLYFFQGLDPETRTISQ